MEIHKTETFDKWFQKLKDQVAKAKISIRLRRMSLGHVGDAKNLGGGLSELKIDHGPGYRVYYTQRGEEIILLLIGGDKSSQDRDISKARIILNEIGA